MSILSFRIVTPCSLVDGYINQVSYSFFLVVGRVHVVNKAPLFFLVYNTESLKIISTYKV